jgi:hypothetical protein
VVFKTSYPKLLYLGTVSKGERAGKGDKQDPGKDIEEKARKEERSMG